MLDVSVGLNGSLLLDVTVLLSDLGSESHRETGGPGR